VEVNFNPLVVDGRIAGVSVFSRDISERVRAEEERQRRIAASHEAQKLESLGVMAGGIAHDFNNLLTGILGHAELVQGELPTDHPALDAVREIERFARRGADLTSRMLTYAGRAHAAVEPTDLGAITAEMGVLLRSVVPKRTELRLSAAPALPLVEADPAELGQVVMNLITNAAEALPDGEGTVDVRVTAVDADAALLAGFQPPGVLRPGRHVLLEVRDTGAGMDDATRARIFDPFFTTKFTGRGLGLAVVGSVVRRHRGGMALSSAPGAGTTFRILFPASDASAVAAAPRPSASQPWAGSGTVLVVDDEEAVRSVARKTLERVGFTVATANDGADGLDRFRAMTVPPVAVVLDLTMPRLGGEEVLRTLRAAHPDLPAVISSGYTGEEWTGRDARTLFLHKPFRPAELVDALRRVLG
jgi:signal transduction histidine kinase/CheY-like chemotaxis protein